MTSETILVIDTDTETANSIVATLESEDYLVFTASGKDIGINMANKVKPALIFINPTMPGTSGLEACKAIHSTEQLKNIPIIVLSSFEGVKDSRYKELYGIVDALKKPFSSEDLISKTRDALSIKTVSAPAEEFGEFFGHEEHVVTKEQEMPEIQKEMTQESTVSDKTDVLIKKQTEESFGKTIMEQPSGEEEKTEHLKILKGEPEETLNDSDDSTVLISKESDRTYVLNRNLRRKNMKKNLLVPIIAAVVIIILGAAGFILYEKGLLPWVKNQVPVASKPPQPSQQQAAKAALPQEQQKQPDTEKKTAQTPPLPPAPAPESKPAVAPSQVPAKTPASRPAQKPEIKPSGKAIYSVQVGAFKNENNAVALTKKYKEIGYEAFMHKSAKDNETLYRVLIGRFENRKEAFKLSENISEKEKTNAVVFKE